MSKDFKKTILVTGGAGFMGSCLIRHLYYAYPNYRIVNFDLLTYAGNLENLANIEKVELTLPETERRYRFIRGDICDEDHLRRLFSEHQFDLVANYAAETHVDRSIINMGDFIRTNIGGVRSLIEAVRVHRVPRFVHISTDEVYGSVEDGYSTEDAPLCASNPYSTSKAAADLIVQSFIRTHKVPALIVRGSNNFGPYQYPEKIIPLAVTNIIEGKKIPIHGRGEHRRRWIHVEDFCRAVDLIAHQAPDYEIYNVSGEEKTTFEILQLIARYLGVSLDQYREHVTDRPGADTRYAPDSTKLRRNLGWTPVYTVASSLGGVADWYLQNQDWWQKIKMRKEYSDHYEKQAKGQWQ